MQKDLKSIDKQLSKAIKTEDVANLVKSLPFIYKRAKVIKRLRAKGDSFEDIAKLFNLSVSGVKTIYYRIVRRSFDVFMKRWLDNTSNIKWLDEMFIQSYDGNSILLDLPTIYKKRILIAKYKDKSYAEIAIKLRMQPEAVASMSKRIKKGATLSEV